MTKKSWYIGKKTEKLAYNELVKYGFSAIRTDVDDAGIDIIAIKDNKCYLIEVKGTYRTEISKSLIKQRFNKEQRMKYTKLKHEFNKNIRTDIILFFFFKYHNKWTYNTYLYDDINDTFIKIELEKFIYNKT